ncbi:MAG: response regulator [Bryobacteraceae bacterium]|nr:response regulator [Bryobacteraceae bacterium]
MAQRQTKEKTQGLGLARVLLADDDPASRLTLQTVLEAGGYCVDSAASAAEAVGKLEKQEYELVLTDLHMESPESGLRVLAHARMMEYKPATALITTYSAKQPKRSGKTSNKPVFVEPENLPELLDKVADLVSDRAQRRVERAMRHAG